ncbi:MAG: hypothetical protein IKR19_07635 [Acholeplasmatales bacterium]|nr:hypothetical protein [Acholeplasmatales bacterium]
MLSNKNVSTLLDLENRVVNKSVLGDWDSTYILEGKIGDSNITVLRLDGHKKILSNKKYELDSHPVQIDKFNDDDIAAIINNDTDMLKLSIDESTGVISLHYGVGIEAGPIFKTTKLYSADIFMRPSMNGIVAGMETNFTESTPSKGHKGYLDSVNTQIKADANINLHKSQCKDKDIYYRVLFNLIKTVPTVVISTQPLDTNSDNIFYGFIKKSEADIYNSATDSNVSIISKKTIVESAIDNIKPRSFDITYNALDKIYKNDYYWTDSEGKHSINSIGIHETYKDNHYEAFYKRKNDSLSFKLDGWSESYIDDDHIKVNVYRTYENIIDIKKGPGNPVPDPNYTTKRIESVNDDVLKNTLDYTISSVSKIILDVLYDIKVDNETDPLSKLDIELFTEDGEPDPNKNVLIPFGVKEDPHLLRFVGSLSFGDTPENQNYISIFGETYITANKPDPIWLVAHYQDPDTNKKYTYKVLYDYNEIIYKDTIEESYTPFRSLAVHTIEMGDYKFRYQNIANTDLSGKKVSETTFIYESPEVEFTKKIAGDKQDLLEFNSAIYDTNDKSIFIRSEYGCVIPYTL